MVRIEAVLRIGLVFATLAVAASVAGCVDQNIPVASRGSSSSGRGNPSDSGTTGASSSGVTSSTGISSSSTTGTGTTGTTTTGTSTTSAGNTNGQDGTSSSTSGTSSGGSTGAVGPYVGFDSGPLFEPVVDLDGGCTAAKPLFDSRTSRCVQCFQDSDCPYSLICDTSVDSCQACSSVDNSGCGDGEVCARLGVSFDLAGYSGCVPNCADAGEVCDPGLCDVYTGLCSLGECVHDSDCDGGELCDQAIGDKCVVCIWDGGGCAPGLVCNTLLGAPTCQPNCKPNPGSCFAGSFCNPSGVCARGCADSTACSGATPICDTAIHACVQCTKAHELACTDGGRPALPDAGCCPSYSPGCGVQDQCGTCVQDADCRGQHCDAGSCTCESDMECPLDAPTCIGLDGGIAGPPVCGCLSSSECQPNFVCEARPPYDRVVSANDGKTFGGICIPVCNEQNVTYCRMSGISGAGAPVGDLYCNTATGYCVQCRANVDCSGWSAVPNCLRFDGGFNDVEFGNQPTATGGGICGCVDTQSCLNNQTCGPLVDWAGLECQAACSVSGGPDSCTSGGYAAQAMPFCDSWTGLCRGCLADYSCTGTTSSWNGISTPWCEPDSGVCIQCSDSSGCPGNLPGCSSDPNTLGACGVCASPDDCPADSGYLCLRAETSSTVPIRQCVIPCVHGDDAGRGTVSDAGLPCPTALPYCVDDGQIQATVCGQCRYGSNDCDSGYCFGTFCHP
jgi:hypothetical protein